jgi:hypothetical protein
MTAGGYVRPAKLFLLVARGLRAVPARGSRAGMRSVLPSTTRLPRSPFALAIARCGTW